MDVVQHLIFGIITLETRLRGDEQNLQMFSNCLGVSQTMLLHTFIIFQSINDPKLFIGHGQAWQPCLAPGPTLSERDLSPVSNKMKSLHTYASNMSVEQRWSRSLLFNTNKYFLRFPNFFLETGLCCICIGFQFETDSSISCCRADKKEE